MPLSQNDMKRAAAKRAAEHVEEGMLVGLGTGSTASFFIESLIERCRRGLKVTVVSSSLKSLEQAKEGGLIPTDVNEITSIDLTVDGADEVDPQNRMIKGGGGAHVREKILAFASKKIIIIVDESKLVQQLGQFGVPVEILPFGVCATLAKIERLDYKGILRKKADGSLFITDNGNYLYDIHFPKQFPDPKKDHALLINMPGVIDTGFFFDLPVKLLVGYADGRIAFRA